ncbi:unnamed protein product, partial [Prunus brigantina]
IESTCIVVYLVHCTPTILVQIQVVCVSLGRTPVAAVGLLRNELGAAKLPSTEVQVIDFSTHMIIRRLTTSKRRVPNQHHTQELLPEVSSGLFIFRLLLEQFASRLEP